MRSMMVTALAVTGMTLSATPGALAALPMDSAVAAESSPLLDTGRSRSLTGTYTLVHHDTQRGKYVPYLEVGHRLIRLHFQHAPQFRLNTRMTVNGDLSGGVMNVSEVSTSGVETTPAAATGARKVLILRVYWNSRDSVTASQAVSQVGGVDNAYFQENSYGQLSLSATATTWLKIPQPTTCNSLGSIQSSAYNAAVNNGYDPDAYHHNMIYISSADCTGGGWGEIEGKWTWIQGAMNNYVTSHELGHNFGSWHSHSLACPNGVSVGDDCTMDEYGDSFDTMGSPFEGERGFNHFNAFQKQHLGWMGSRLQTVSSAGNYTLPAYESQGAGVRALRIATPKRTYFVENREAVGFDEGLPLGATSGALIHIAGAVNGSDLIDMTPITASDFYDAALPVGSSWGDPEGVFWITVNSDTSAGLSLKVSFGGQPPNHSLDVSTSGAGSGTVTSTPSGIDCGTSCSASYANGTSVTLTATPATGSTFSGWGGACSGSTTCTVSMTSDRDVSAAFGSATTSQETATAASYDTWVGGDGTIRTSNVANATATYRFSGTGVTWVSRKGISQGIAAVSIDGVSKGTVDLYSATPQSFSKSYTGLSTGTHTITIKVTGTKNPSSGNTWVAIDAFKVGTTTVQDNSWRVLYNAWYGVASASASGGAYRSSSTAGSSFSFSFSGTAIDWITAVGPGWGKAKVYIDGVDKGTVDLYSSTQRWQAVKSYSGLSSGTHTIQVRPLGTKNAASSSTKVVVDAFVVR